MVLLGGQPRRELIFVTQKPACQAQERALNRYYLILMSHLKRQVIVLDVGCPPNMVSLRRVDSGET